MSTKNTILKAETPHPTNLYMLYPMMQRVLLVCVEKVKKMVPQGGIREFLETNFHLTFPSKFGIVTWISNFQVDLGEIIQFSTSLSGRDFPDKRDLNSGLPGARMTRKSYSRLPKSLGWIANAANSNLLPHALHSIHFISKQPQQQQQQQQQHSKKPEYSIMVPHVAMSMARRCCHTTTPLECRLNHYYHVKSSSSSL